MIKPSQKLANRAQERAASKVGKSDKPRDTMIALVLNAAIWLAAFGSVFFCEGRSYRDAYLTTYGLYPAMFPWERGDVIYFGFYVGFGDLFSVFLWPAIFGCYALVIAIAGSNFLQKRRARSRVPGPDQLSTRTSAVKTLPPLLTFILTILAIAGAAMGAMVLLAIMFDHAQARGVNNAKAEIRAEDSCGPAVANSNVYSAVHIVRDLPTGPQSYDGFLITCAAANCAVRDPIQRRSRVVPRDNISTFDTVPKESLYLPGIGAIADLS